VIRIILSVSGAIGSLLKPLIPPMSKRLVMRSGKKHKQEKTAPDVTWTTVRNNQVEIA